MIHIYTREKLTNSFSPPFNVFYKFKLSNSNLDQFTRHSLQKVIKCLKTCNNAFCNDIEFNCLRKQ